MTDYNPFGAPSSSPHISSSPMAGSPFDPWASSPATPTPPQHGAAPTQTKGAPQTQAGYDYASQPFGGGAEPPQQIPMHNQQQTMPFGQSTAQTMAAYPQQREAPQFAPYDSYAMSQSPFAPHGPIPGATPYAPQGQVPAGSPYPNHGLVPMSPQYSAQGYASPGEQAVVISQTQSNPYAGLVANPFDPFAAPPAPAPVYEYTQFDAMEAYQPQAVSFDQSDQLGPFGDPLPQPPAPAPPAEKTPEPSKRRSYEHSNEPAAPSERQMVSSELSVRNRYSRELAKQAPPGASPLPKAELVRKKGYVLARISFRTIVTKKWKQTFWAQYGPHTMLWFRSETDFDDWLNNPYHDQTQRNFLIKLAVNFVHDLYKPNVRGYQVTQSRTKGYGKKLVRQFKLERWMDYGPTIAAAFGAYNPKEVDDLRDALVDCMRNTPLNGNIRATGAVRQRGGSEEDDGE
jgi:hypothetical protein